MRIGIFGGSFNPPHKMHKSIVKELIKKGYLDKAIVIPTGDDYNKLFLLKGIDRYNMLKNIFRNDKNVEVSSCEIKEKRYTIETLNYFHKKYPKAELFFICGTDNLADFHKWYHADEILKKYKLLVIKRDTNDYYTELERYGKYKNHITLASVSPQTISSTLIRNEIIKRGYTKKLREYMYADTINYLKKIDAKKYWKNC